MLSNMLGLRIKTETKTNGAVAGMEIRDPLTVGAVPVFAELAMKAAITVAGTTWWPTARN